MNSAYRSEANISSPIRPNISKSHIESCDAWRRILTVVRGGGHEGVI